MKKISYSKIKNIYYSPCVEIKKNKSIFNLFGNLLLIFKFKITSSSIEYDKIKACSTFIKMINVLLNFVRF